MGKAAHKRVDVILQGEVELISLMPPKARNENETGMLEYLEVKAMLGYFAAG